MWNNGADTPIATDMPMQLLDIIDKLAANSVGRLIIPTV